MFIIMMIMVIFDDVDALKSGDVDGAVEDDGVDVVDDGWCCFPCGQDVLLVMDIDDDVSNADVKDSNTVGTCCR